MRLARAKGTFLDFQHHVSERKVTGLLGFQKLLADKRRERCDSEGRRLSALRGHLGPIVCFLQSSS